MPESTYGLLTVFRAYNYRLQLYTIIQNDHIYFRKSTDGGSTWSSWVLLNNSANLTDLDIPKTTLTPEFPGEARVASGGVAINYVVKNGWCNVNFEVNLASATTFTWTRIASGLPKPANNVNIVLTDETGKLNRTIAIKITSTGSVSSRIPVAFTANDWWCGNISYPVAE